MATIGRPDMMHRAARISTTRAEKAIPTEVEAAVDTMDAVDVTGGSHPGATAPLEMAPLETTAAGSTSYSRTSSTFKIRTTAMIVATATHTARSSTATVIEAQINHRPASGTLEKIGTGDMRLPWDMGGQQLSKSQSPVAQGVEAIRYFGRIALEL